jgi:hypothetical protein
MAGTVSAMSTFRYTRWDEKVVAEAEGGPKVAHADVDFVYEGPLKGESRAQLLLHYRPDGTGTFVGYELLTGSFDDEPGSYVLAHNGTFDAAGIESAFEVRAGGEIKATGTYRSGPSQEVPYTITSR